MITLGIIGIVAALTIPQIISKYNEKVTIHRVEAAYSQLSQAYTSLLYEYGTPDSWQLTQTNAGYLDENPAKMFQKVLKLNDICHTRSTECHLNAEKNVYKSLTGLEGDSHIFGTAAKLNDMKLIFTSFTPACRGWSQYSWEKVTESSPYFHACGRIYVDINGSKAPNKHGIDMFSFIYTDKKIIPEGVPPTPYYSLGSCCNPNMTSWDGSVNGSFCGAWIIVKKNMDYLRKEVSW